MLGRMPRLGPLACLALSPVLSIFGACIKDTPRPVAPPSTSPSPLDAAIVLEPKTETPGAQVTPVRTPIPASVAATEEHPVPGLVVRAEWDSRARWTIQLDNSGDSEMVVSWAGSTFILADGRPMGSLVVDGGETEAPVSKVRVNSVTAIPAQLAHVPADQAIDLMQGGRLALSIWTADANYAWVGVVPVYRELDSATRSASDALASSKPSTAPPTVLPAKTPSAAEIEAWKESLSSSQFNHGSKPANYVALTRKWFANNLRDPASARYGRTSKPRKEQEIVNQSEKKALFGWSVCAFVNAKNGFGGYTGNTPYWFLIVNGAIVDAREVEEGDEIYIGHPINCSDGP